MSLEDCYNALYILIGNVVLSRSLIELLCRGYGLIFHEDKSIKLITRLRKRNVFTSYDAMVTKIYSSDGAEFFINTNNTLLSLNRLHHSIKPDSNRIAWIRHSRAFSLRMNKLLNKVSTIILCLRTSNLYNDIVMEIVGILHNMTIGYRAMSKSMYKTSKRSATLS
jgi:hypothetical protein